MTVGVSKRSLRSNPLNTAGLIPEMSFTASTFILDYRSPGSVHQSSFPRMRATWRALVATFESVILYIRELYR
jgi:hypothetical protein